MENGHTTLRWSFLFTKTVMGNLTQIGLCISNIEINLEVSIHCQTHLDYNYITVQHVFGSFFKYYLIHHSLEVDTGDN